MSSYLCNNFECTLPCRNFVQAENFNQKNFEQIVNPSDVVINCIGVLKYNIAKYGQRFTENINSIFPRQLSEVCARKKARLIHFSSDCVFSGKKGKYLETDICDAKDVYARTKSKEPKECSTIRTSFIGLSRNPSNQSLVNFLLTKKGQEIKGFNNCLWNGVCCLELVKIVEKIINDDVFWSGVRNVYSERIVSKYELCKIINEVYKLNIRITPFRALEISGSNVPESGFLDRSLSSIFENLNKKDLIQQVKEQFNFDFKSIGVR